MAYTAGFTAIAGATFTAAQYNTNVRDNFSAIWAYTTAGDIVYASSATALARLGIGAAGTVLKSNGSKPVWGSIAFSGANVTRASSQSISNATWTLITYTTETFDTDGYWSAGSPTKLIIPETGYYLVGCITKFAANANNEPEIMIYINGSTPATRVTGGTRPTGHSQLNISVVNAYTKNDYLEAKVYQNSGGALNVENSTFWIARLG